MMEDTLMQKLMESYAPSGNEAGVHAAIRAAIPSGVQVEVDAMGNLKCRLPGKISSRPVMIMAHADQVSMQVSHIDEDGYIYFSTFGGIDQNLLPGRQLVIHGEKGPVTGVVGAKPVHLQSKQAGGQEKKELFLDIGATDGMEASLSAAVGDYITYKAAYAPLAGRRFSGTSIDNRAGVYVVLETIRKIATLREPPPVDIWAIFTAQEEVGLRGAKVASSVIRPCFAVCIETEFATDYPGMDKHALGEIRLGHGPVLPRGPATAPHLVRLLEKVAERENIRYQRRSLTDPQGTEAAEIQVSGSGVRTALLMIPIRYMHTAMEVACRDDMEAGVRLLTALLTDEGLGSLWQEGCGGKED